MKDDYPLGTAQIYTDEAGRFMEKRPSISMIEEDASIGR